MSDQRDNSIWPFLCILTCLFVLSATSPRTWEKTLAERRQASIAGRVEPIVSKSEASRQPFGGAGVVAKLSPIPCLVEDPGVDLSGVGEWLAGAAGEVEAEAVIQPGGEFLPADPAARIADNHTEAVENADSAEFHGDLLAGPMEEIPVLLDEIRSEAMPVVDEALESASDAMPSLDTAVSAGPALPESGELAEADSGETPSAAAEPSPADIATQALIEDSLSRPEALLSRLDDLAWDCETGIWARAAARQLRKLSVALALHSDETGEILKQLIEIEDEGGRLASRLDDVSLAAAVERTRQSLRRRVDIWEQAIAMPSLLARVEQYERTGTPRDAQSLAGDTLRFASSPIAEERELGRRLDSYYRNANIRFTVTGELLNRLLPERTPEYEPVHDVVLGNPVRGCSMTTTTPTVLLVPDAKRLRAALVVRGRVASETSAFAGPATFFNTSALAFAARKDVELGTFGLRGWPAQVNVENATRLRGLETDFDLIPIVGWVAQDIALSQHQQKRWQADKEVKEKAQARVIRQIESEVGQRLGDLSGRMNERLFGPLTSLSLGPDVIGAETTEERMTARLRLASAGQLGAATPRPQALLDSLASIQVHETALNNLVERLELDGQTFTIQQLRGRIATRLNRPEMLETETPHDQDVVITFAPSNGVQVRCQDGRIAITLSVAALCQADNRWDDFQVQTFYRPRSDRSRVELVRDGVVYLIGDGLNLRSQIALRGIFSKTFSKERPLVLTPRRILDDPRFAGLGLTQLVVEDGWIGVAVGIDAGAGTPVVAGRRTGPRQ